MGFTIDMHCHPSLKSYLFDSDVTEDHKTYKDFNLFDQEAMQVDIPKMKKGEVNCVLSAHYLPEIGLIKNCSLLKSTRALLKIFLASLMDRIEKDSSPDMPFKQTMSSIQSFENYVKKSPDAIIARNFNELKRGIEEKKLVFVHSIEGGHSLGRSSGTNNLPDEFYFTHLKQFFDCGVCMITLAHFFSNDLVTPVIGFPPSMAKLLGLKQPDDNGRPGLSLTGEKVVKKMFELGMIVDMTHCTTEARQRIFEINNNEHPLVISHAGVNTDRLPTRDPLNVTEEDILKIKACDGVIGIAFLINLLTGKEEKKILDIFGTSNDYGIESIIENIMEINRITGSFDNIALGSDFDGFTDPPDDLQDCSLLPVLKSRLKNSGIPETEIDKIFGDNILRVLEKGWLKQ
jgi:membrane dipeptidase